MVYIICTLLVVPVLCRNSTKGNFIHDFSYAINFKYVHGIRGGCSKISHHFSSNPFPCRLLLRQEKKYTTTTAFLYPAVVAIPALHFSFDYWHSCDSLWPTLAGPFIAG